MKRSAELKWLLAPQPTHLPHTPYLPLCSSFFNAQLPLGQSIAELANDR